MVDTRSSPPNASQEEVGDSDGEGQTQHRAKAPRRDKGNRVMVESTHLSTMVASYNQQFGEYSKTKKHVTQLIPSIVWKAVYENYLQSYPESTLAEDTLKDRLRDTLKDLKTGTSNNDGAETVVLQSEEVLMRLKSTDGHATRNVLKRRQSLIEGMVVSSSTSTPQSTSSPMSTSTVAPAPTPSSIAAAAGRTPTPTPTSSGGMTSNSIPSGSMPLEKEKNMTKSEMLHQQTSSIALLAKQYQANVEHKGALSLRKDALIAEKLEMIRTKKDAVKMDMLKQAKELGVISEEEFKAKVREVLDL